MHCINHQIHRIRLKWRRYPIFAIISGTGPVSQLFTSLVVTDNNMIKQIMSDNESFPKPKSHGIYQIMHRESCTSANGAEMTRQREILTKIFGYFVANSSRNIINLHAQHFCQWIANQIQKRDTDTIDFAKSYSYLSADLIIELVLGKEFLIGHPNFQKQFLEFWDLLRLPSPNGREIMLIHEKFDEMRCQLEPSVFNYEQKQAEQNEETKCNCLLDYLMEQTTEYNRVLNTETEFSHYEIIHNLWSFLVAGFETVAGTLTLTTYHLAKHPKYLESLRKECFEREKEPFLIFQRPYLWNFIRETLRLYPPVLNMPRVTTNNGCPFGFGVSKGTHILPDILSPHLDKNVFRDPLKFRPERWERCDSRMSEHFWAFGGGKKPCLGRYLGLMEIGIVLTRILMSDYQFQLPKGYKLEIAQTPTIRVMNGLPLYVTCNKTQAHSHGSL